MKTDIRERDAQSPPVMPLVTVQRIDFLAPRKDKNRWPLSFMLAVAAHCLVLFAGHYFIVQPAGYGVEGASASMEIYMMAALPDQTERAPAAPEAVPPFPEAESEMTEARAPEESDKKAIPKETEPEHPKQEAQPTESKGDGSAADEPGNYSTSFYSQASSETAGREGKYRNQPPGYPAIAERNGWEGTVLLKAHIKQEGEPAAVGLEESSGHRVLDDAALKTVKKWKFTPGTFGNTAVSSWIHIPIRFTLDK